MLVDLEPIPTIRRPPGEILAFWGEFTWADNPWLPDSNAPRLAHKKYARIESTPLSKLAITRSGKATYTVQVPTETQYEEGRTVAKLERWVIAILLSSPKLQIGEALGRRPQLTLRGAPKLQHTYEWKVMDNQSI